MTTVSNDEAVVFIATALGETKDGPRKQIALIVRLLGAERCLHLLAEATRIEEQGGITLATKARRRTFGGVFFRLVRQQQMSDADRRTIFGNYVYGRAVGPPPPAPLPPFKWAEYRAMLAELQTEVAIVDSLSGEVKGRPSRVIEREKVVIVRMERASTTPFTGVSADIPIPQRLAPTPCVVMIRRKIWAKIKASLDQHADDKLIAKGPAYWDAEREVFTIAATVATTQRMEIEKREKQKAEQNTPQGL